MNDDKNQTDDSTTQAVDPTVVPAGTAAEEVAAEPTTEKATEEAPDAEEAPTAPVASSNEPTGTDQQGRQLYTVKCSTCGQDTQVPFKPSDGRPVYCRDDFMKMRNSQ